MTRHGDLRSAPHSATIVPTSERFLLPPKLGDVDFDALAQRGRVERSRAAVRLGRLAHQAVGRMLRRLVRRLLPQGDGGHRAHAA